MFTRKVDRHLLVALPWYIIALILNGATVAEAQYGGGMAPPAEQRLFPNGLPKMELMLKGAIEHHPDVLAARSKLRTAEAEQRQAEFKALKDILEVRDRWEKANRAAAATGGNPEEVRDRLAALAAVEWELAYLLGTRGDTASEPKVGEKEGNTPQAVSNVLPSPAIVEAAIPRGEQAKSLKKRLSQQMTLNIAEMPLTDFVKSLSEQSGTRILLDKQALEDEGFPADSPVGVELDELELGAALQVLEDLYKPMCFVVRDYGVLVTTQSERSHTKVSVIDFWKLSEDELRDKLRHEREEELKQSTGGMMGGGMGGGGYFSMKLSAEPQP